jgi:lipid-A-disaccharide synthase
VSRLHIGVVAGEASGDILGARVLAALRERFDEVVVEGIGGPLMQEQGLASLYSMERLSVMGFIDPLKRLPELLRIRRRLRQHFCQRPPDLFLGIDAPDFNLRLEMLLRRSGIPTAHLVSPSVWAWRRGRVRKIRRAVDLMLCLFPFETNIYLQHGVPVRYIGHPLADEISPDMDSEAVRRQLELAGEGRLLALLPGSRESEVRLLAPLFLQAARLLHHDWPQLSFAIPAASEERLGQLQGLLQEYPDLPVTLVPGRSREVMAAADTVLLASGTATLEAALIGRPMVVAYRMGALSWQLLSRLLKTPYAALPNILAGRALVPELIQARVTPPAMVAALRPLLAGGEDAACQLQGFDTIRRDLRKSAAESAASALAELVADGS